MQRSSKALIALALALSSTAVQSQTIGAVAGSGGGGSGTVTSVATGACLTGGPITSTGTIAGTYLVNAQTGTSYTVLSTDACKLVNFSNASAIAVTVPQATTTFGAGFSFDVQNIGAGSVTLTPTTSTINGSASLVIATNQGCTITSDGTNWLVSACTALGSTGAPGGSNTQLQYNNSGVFGGISGLTTDGSHLALATAGAASTPSLLVSGAPFAGTGTTSFPLVYINTSGASAPTVFATAGTLFGGNASGTSVNLVDFYANGVQKFVVNGFGAVTFAGGSCSGAVVCSNGNMMTTAGSSQIGVVTRAVFTSPAAGFFQLGPVDGAAPVAYTLGFNSGAGTNIAGQNATIMASRATGTASSGDLIFQTGGAVGGSGTTQATATTAMTIKGVTQSINIAKLLNLPLTTPASSSAACTTGDFEVDASFAYVCTATNTWKRTALSTF
jgi:hypothetical protein